VNWAERNQPLLKKMRAYASDFSRCKPLPFEYFSGGGKAIFPLAVESDRGVALLLFYSALRQGIREDRLARFLASLWEEYQVDVFRLNHVPFADLQRHVNAVAEIKMWPLLPKVPGILRSVCDFFFRHGRVLAWVRQVGDGEECVRALAEEIFLMGKTSLLRPKARHYLWLLTQLPGVDAADFWRESTLLHPTPGHSRLLRELGPLKNRRAPWTTPEEKVSYYNRFYRVLFPGKAYLAFAGFDAYLDPDPEHKWNCRRILGGCENCALVELCPGREI
jgi:hypothetical protein